MSIMRAAAPGPTGLRPEAALEPSGALLALLDHLAAELAEEYVRLMEIAAEREQQDRTAAPASHESVAR